MNDMREDISTILDPAKIKNAHLASSPYVLRKAFKADPTIRRLIENGEKVISLIAEETKKGERLNEITLSAFAFIVESVKPEVAAEIFGDLFREFVKKPGPYFVHFAAHAIRSGLKLPVKTLEIVYSREELIETQNKLP